jgi:hypothetical protein
MASKKKSVRRHRSVARGQQSGMRRRPPRSTGQPPAVLKLSKRARDEVAELLRRSRIGSLPTVELQTGLREVKRQLGVVADFIFDFRNW